MLHNATLEGCSWQQMEWGSLKCVGLEVKIVIFIFAVQVTFSWRGRKLSSYPKHLKWPFCCSITKSDSDMKSTCVNTGKNRMGRLKMDVYHFQLREKGNKTLFLSSYWFLHPHRWFVAVLLSCLYFLFMCFRVEWSMRKCTAYITGSWLLKTLIPLW